MTLAYACADTGFFLDATPYYPDGYTFAMMAQNLDNYYNMQWNEGGWGVGRI
jgi:hypothetical protein